MTSQVNTVGKAVYLEFCKPGMTTQVLFMPQAVSASTAVVPFSMYRRRISTVQPRKTWKLISGSVLVNADTAPLKPLEFTEGLFTSLALNGWKLRDQPIIVDVTPEDAECVRTMKTPYKALGRVWKVRKFLGFPADFIDPVVVSTSKPF